MKTQKILFPAAVCILSFVLTLAAQESDPAAKRPHLDKAKQWGELIIAQAVQSGDGMKWPVKFNSTEEFNNSICDGTTGVVFFLLEAYGSTGDKKYLDYARSGADYLLGVMDKEYQAGLYVGISAIGYALHLTYKACGKDKYLEGVRKCLQFLQDNAIEKGECVYWNDSSEILYGGAGIGLFLLYAARELDDQSALDLAGKAGKQLLQVSIPANGGLWWEWWPGRGDNCPNFAHGTAGIAYFLARLYEKTGEQDFLDAAVSGAVYLQSIAYTEGDVCLIDSRVGGTINYYLGWCHGPVGTSRLFYQLYRVTGDKAWFDWVKRCANGIIKSGFPSPLAKTIGARYGQCCGASGIARFFLDLYLFTHQKEYLDQVGPITDHIYDGEKLYGAESEFANRIGYNWGLAGGAVWSLHLDAFEQNKLPLLCLPDSPWTPTSRFDFCVKKIRGAKKKYSRGDEFKLTVKVQNLGDRESAATTVTCYLSNENKPMSGFPQLTKEIASVTLDPIPAGKTGKVKFKTSIPGDAPKGRHFLIICVDKDQTGGDNLIYNNYLACKSKTRIK